jgi:hypothetical protein
MESVPSAVLIQETPVDKPDPAERVSKPPGHEPAPSVGEPAGSVTRWLGDLKAGDEQALQALWDRYYAMLVERARGKLRALRSSTAVNDEENVASSAFQSFLAGLVVMIPGDRAQSL